MERNIQNLISLYTRELTKLQKELLLFPDEKSIWRKAPGISNSAGNLTLHLIGNLKHFIGATLGNLPYTRIRELEFSTAFVERHLLVTAIDETIACIQATLPNISKNAWNSAFPQKINEEEYQTDLFVQHLLIHLGYHLGQINYLRRLLSA